MKKRKENSTRSAVHASSLGRGSRPEALGAILDEQPDLREAKAKNEHARRSSLMQSLITSLVGLPVGEWVPGVLFNHPQPNQPGDGGVGAGLTVRPGRSAAKSCPIVDAVIDPPALVLAFPGGSGR